MTNDNGDPCSRLQSALWNLLFVAGVLLALCEFFAAVSMATGMQYRITVYLALASLLGIAGTVWCYVKRAKNLQLTEESQFNSHRHHAEMLLYICRDPQCVSVANSFLTLIVLAGLSWTSYGAVTLGDCACPGGADVSTGCGVWTACWPALVLVVLRFCSWTVELCWLLSIACNYFCRCRRADYEHLQSGV